MKEIILTTSNSIEGRQISEYIGIVSGESSIGTGVISEMLAGAADFFGTESGAFSSKLGESKAKAISKMKENAIKIGADAIIGINIEVMTTNNNMFISCANGTAVRLSMINDTQTKSSNNTSIIKELAVSNYSNLYIRISSASFEKINNSSIVCVKFIGKELNGTSFDAIKADIRYINVFNESIERNNISLGINHCDDIISMSFYEKQLDINDILLLADLKVYIKAFVSNNKMNQSPEINHWDINMDNSILLENRQVYGIDYCGPVEISEDSWKCVCGCKNSKDNYQCSVCNRNIDTCSHGGNNEELYKQALNQTNACDIYRIYKEYLETHTDPEIESHIEKLHSFAELERMYGNKKNKAIAYIQENIL